MITESKWYVVYTKPRWEKKVSQKLEEKGLANYCPLNKAVRQWSDRKKVVYEPLFKGYVFVYVGDAEKVAVRQIDGIVNFVYWNGKPAVVRPEEIETIQRFLNEFEDVSVESNELDIHQRVVVKKGLLVNYQGIILELLGNKVKVLIESMGVKLSATVDKKNLQVI